MPRGPNGEKRPADAIGCAVNVARIATGEQADTAYVSKKRRKSGVAGAKARNEAMTADQRLSIATHAAQTRWHQKEGKDMSSGAAQLSSLLFDEGRELVNFKFLPGNGRGLTADQMQEEAARVIRSAISKGPVHNPPVTGRAKRSI